MKPQAAKRTAADKRRRASQRDILGGALLSTANALEASHTGLQTLHAAEAATLTPAERRALAKVMSQLALIVKYLRMMGKRMGKNRDTRAEQATWNGGDDAR